MKKTAIVAALAASLVATAAQAGSVRVEAEGQFTGDDRGAVKVEAWEGLGPVGVGFEAKTYASDAGRPAFTDLVGKLGYALPTIAGFTPVVKAEAGVTTGQNNNEFWGVGGELHRELTDKISANVGYRYRESFSGDIRANEDKRAHAAVDYKLNKNFIVSATYYNYAVPGNNINGAALAVTRKF